MRVLSVCVIGALVIGACGTDEAQPAVPQPAATATISEPAPAQIMPEPTVAGDEDTPSAVALYPDVIRANASRADDDTWAFAVTLSSPYDSPERYADAWRVLSPDGTELGVRILAHDHGSEQPFTRSLTGIEVPAGVTVVTIEGRDQVSGWGGATIEVELSTG